MSFAGGFLAWAALAVVGGFVVWAVFRAAGTSRALSYVFAGFGAFIGGMLGTSPYIWHDPSPLRLGALLGAAAGAFLFPWTYHVVAKKLV